MMQAQVGVSWGLMKDVIDLKRRYDILGGRTYRAFIDAWHEEKMPYIICGLQSLAETVEFTEETYHVARAYLSSSATYRENVFGMFLLNAFYNCQHLKKEVKVMVTLQEWNDLLELQEKFVENGDDKAAFLFCLMRINNTFVASASTRSHGLEKNFRKYFNVVKSYYKYSSFNYKNSQELLESDLLSELDKLRLEAVEVRERISNPCSSVLSKELPDIKCALQEVVYDIKLCDVRAQYSIQSTQQSGESSDGEEMENIGARRQQLKRTSFASHRQSPRHRRDSSARSHTQSSSQESEPEARASDSDYSPTKSNKKKKKKKGKRGRPRKVVKELE